MKNKMKTFTSIASWLAISAIPMIWIIRVGEANYPFFANSAYVLAVALSAAIAFLLTAMALLLMYLIFKFCNLTEGEDDFDF